ncbi:MAG: acyl-CoA thioesterase [Flavobacteriales bacterium]
MTLGKGVVSIEIPVAWGEQDLFGHVNNVVYFRYFENVRMYFLERTGIFRSHNETGIGVILASTTCDFKIPVEWPQKLTINTACTAVGNTSFTLGYEIFDEQKNLVATGISVQVMYDYERATKVPIPEPIRSAIKQLEG